MKKSTLGGQGSPHRKISKMKKLSLTTPEFIDLEHSFTDWLRTLGYAESSVYSLPLHVREFLCYSETQGIKKIAGLEGKQVKGFFAVLHARGHQRREGQTLSHAYLNKYLQALKLLSRYVRQTGQGTFTVKRQGIQQVYTIKNILSKKEIESLYAACDNDILGLRDRAILSIFYGCGLRRNEGVSLDVKDILLDNGLLYVRKGKNYKERYLPINGHVKEDIEGYLQEGRPFFYRSEQQRAFFLSKQGKRAEGQSLALRLRRLAKIAGLETGINLHLLRHSIATHLLGNGMKVQQIADFLGHSSLESTQIYTRIKDGKVH